MVGDGFGPGGVAFPLAFFLLFPFFFTLHLSFFIFHFFSASEAACSLITCHLDYLQLAEAIYIHSA